MAYTYDYPRPCVTADVVLFRLSGGRREVLLIRRGEEPFKGQWALPGGHLDESDRNLEAAAVRELSEETGVRGVTLLEFKSYSDTDRDPRGRYITVAHWGVLIDDKEPMPGSDAVAIMWAPCELLGDIEELPLAFDHRRILTDVMQFVDTMDK